MMAANISMPNNIPTNPKILSKFSIINILTGIIFPVGYLYNNCFYLEYINSENSDFIKKKFVIKKIGITNDNRFNNGWW